MHRLLAIALLLALPAVASAQQSVHQHHSGGRPMDAMPMDHMQMMHGGGMLHRGQRQPDGRATEPGQAAFAAIQEVIQILEADPKTDWSKVDIEALRQHLIDMNNVTMAAQVKSETIEGGMRFIVTGEGAVGDSIRRMTSAHAATMDGVDDWHFIANETSGGSVFEVRVPATETAELKGLGFIGVMTRGMHHQDHHLMIARGEHPHH
jgi:hypothetical protein